MKNNTQAESAPAPAGGHDATPWVGSDTPLTDQAEALPIGFWSCATVPSAFARRLERERDRLKEVLQDLVEYLDLTHLPKRDGSLGIKCDRARKTISPSTKAGD